MRGRFFTQDTGSMRPQYIRRLFLEDFHLPGIVSDKGDSGGWRCMSRGVIQP